MNTVAVHPTEAAPAVSLVEGDGHLIGRLARAARARGWHRTTALTDEIDWHHPALGYDLRIWVTDTGLDVMLRRGDHAGSESWAWSLSVAELADWLAVHRLVPSTFAPLYVRGYGNGWAARTHHPLPQSPLQRRVNDLHEVIVQLTYALHPSDSADHAEIVRRARHALAQPIDPIGCPCCGETPWCPAARAEALRELTSAPELRIGGAA